MDPRLWFLGVVAVVGIGMVIAGLVLLRKPAPARADPLPRAVLTEDASGSVGVKAGQPAPLFELQADDGTILKLSDLRGKPVLIDFFATWCPPCVQEMPGIQESYEKLKDRGFVVISIDMQESNSKVAGFIAKYGLSFPVGIDSSAALATRYGVYGIPANFFVDKDGIVRFVDAGLTPALIEQRLSSLW